MTTSYHTTTQTLCWYSCAQGSEFNSRHCAQVFEWSRSIGHVREMDSVNERCNKAGEFERKIQTKLLTAHIHALALCRSFHKHTGIWWWSQVEHWANEASARAGWRHNLFQ